MRVRTLKPSSGHEAFRNDLLEVLRKHGDALSAQEMLALASHLVGQLVALQDQRAVTPEGAMEIVSANIEIGNREAIDGLLRPKGSA